MGRYSNMSRNKLLNTNVVDLNETVARLQETHTSFELVTSRFISFHPEILTLFGAQRGAESSNVGRVGFTKPPLDND